MRDVKKYSYIILGFLLIFTFQNCSSEMQFKNQNDPILSKSGGPSVIETVELPEVDLDDEDEVQDMADESDTDYNDNDDSEDPSYNYDAVNYEALCNELKDAELTPVADGDSIRRFRGEGSFSIDHLNKIHKVRGKIAVVGQSDSSDIQVVHRFRGQMLICFADVARLKKVRGDVIVVGGNVGDVSKFRGRLILLGGHITGQVSHSRRAHIEVR